MPRPRNSRVVAPSEELLTREQPLVQQPVTAAQQQSKELLGSQGVLAQPAEDAGIAEEHIVAGVPQEDIEAARAEQERFRGTPLGEIAETPTTLRDGVNTRLAELEGTPRKPVQSFETGPQRRTEPVALSRGGTEDIYELGSEIGDS